MLFRSVLRVEFYVGIVYLLANTYLSIPANVSKSIVFIAKKALVVTLFFIGSGFIGRCCQDRRYKTNTARCTALGIYRRSSSVGYNLTWELYSCVSAI